MSVREASGPSLTRSHEAASVGLQCTVLAVASAGRVFAQRRIDVFGTEPEAVEFVERGVVTALASRQ